MYSKWTWLSAPNTTAFEPDNELEQGCWWGAIVTLMKLMKLKVRVKDTQTCLWSFNFSVYTAIYMHDYVRSFVFAAEKCLRLRKL